uniref:Vitellogenin domain-containing protein n=1 Tax=Nothobranchius furzeri TaxID=105023 RepID=A0A8C6MGE3_NOTFU
MWGTKLCVLLLLGTHTLAQQDEEQSPGCFLAKRFKNLRRFVYNYEAETLNGVNGASDDKSGPKVSCTVEVDVPQMCSFILRTTDCSVSEISGVDDDGTPKYRPAAGTEAFKAAMAKNPLKLSVEGKAEVKLFPEDDESTNILNIKRGIISALMVPDLDMEENKEMPTVHGVCSTEFSVNFREDIAVDVTVSRDLSKCNRFVARRQDTSPLALISGMNYPLSKMISSTQVCNYKFDNQKKHMTSGSCTEKHIFLPFSHRNEYGISTVVRQTVTLRETSVINDRIFNHNEANLKHLPMDVADDKLPVQSKDAVVAMLQKLSTLSETSVGEERAGLFRKLVSELRGLKSDVLTVIAEEMLDIDSLLTWQALAQCGTPECTSGILKILRGFDHEAMDVDVFVYGLGMLSNPSRLLVKDLLEMAQYKQSKPIMYALSNAVRRFEGVTPEITAVYEFMASLLGTDCAGEKELTFLTLRVVGNMGDAMEAADPAIKNTLIKCMRQPATTLSVQLAAIQTFRRMSVTDEVRTNLQKVSQYQKGAVQKRLAAYLILMKDPQDSDFEMVKNFLSQEQNVQVKAFVSSHVYNIISSTDSETKKLAQKIMAVLQDTEVATHDYYTTKSRNYKLGVAYENSQADIQGNVIFDPSNQLPKEVLLEMTLKAFGYSMDIWEVGMEGKGFNPTIEALFGQDGFFPDTVSKTLYWAEDKMSPKIKEFLKNWVVQRKPGHQKEIVRSFNNLLKDLQGKESPEAMAYLRIMGAELGYIKGSDLRFIVENAIVNANAFIMPSTDNEMFLHYIFMDNKFILPTASGLPMTFALSGTFAPGAKGGIQISPNMELIFSPSVGVEFMTKMGVHMPEFVVSAVEMQTNLFHESSLEARITMEQNQVKLSIPAPKKTTKLFRISNKLEIVGAEQSRMIPHTVSRSNCSPLFSGMKYCTTMLYTEAPDRTNSPYFPLTGETMFSFDIEPTNKISEYTASIAYKLLSEGKDGRQKVDSLKMVLRAEGAQPTEATATMKYNRNRNVLTTQIQIPDVDIEAGMKIGMTDSSSKGKSIFLEFSNKNMPQLSLIGRAKPILKVNAELKCWIVHILGEEQAEVHVTSNVNADTKVPVHYTKALQAQLGQIANEVMDKQVVKTDMKLRHILNKGMEVSKTSSQLYFFLRNFKEILFFFKFKTLWFYVFTSESTLRYQFNQNSFTMTIPLPLGGKSSEELRMPPVITSPRISVPQLGLDLAPQKIKVPRFTIPSEYDLTLPLMGLMEMSAKVNSNYYDWEGIITAGNNTKESPEYVAKFSMLAESPIKLLSFSAEDNVLTTGRYNIYATAKPVGLDTSLTVTTQYTLDSNMLFGDINTDGSVTIGSMVATTTYLNTFSIEPAKKEAKMESTLRVNSDALKLVNKMKTSYENDEFLFESTTNMNCDPVMHTTKINLGYKEVKFTFLSDSVTKAYEKIIRSQMEFSTSGGQTALRIENQADDTQNRAYSLLTGVINPSGLEINADASVNLFASLTSHKATLSVTTNGLTTSCTTTAQHRSVKFENIVHGGVDASGATLSLTTKGAIQDSKAEFNVEGKLASTEVYFNSKYMGNLFDISSRNTVNLRLNENGLVFSNNMAGSFYEMKTENAHSLSLTLRSFTLQSKTDNILDSSNSYMHDISVNVDHFTVSAAVKNDLKVMAVNFVNNAQFKAEPYNVELAGKLMGVYLNEELEHTYEIKFLDMILSAKCNTNGKLLGSHMTHSTDMEVAGLTVKYSNMATFNSPLLRLDSTVKMDGAPFTLNIDAIFNSNGEVFLYGKHNGELYSKYLMKAEPTMFTQSFEYRTSSSHEMSGRPTIRTNMDHKFNSMLSLHEQSVLLKVESTVNDHTFNEEMSAYNNAERMGIEMKGAVSTPLFSETSQDYAISGFMKYDKNSNSHFLQIPFIEHLPAAIDNIKTMMMKLMNHSTEMLRDIDAKYEIRARFQDKVAELKEAIDNFDFNLFIEDIKQFMTSMEKHITKLTRQFPIDKVVNLLKYIKDTIRAAMKKYNISNKLSAIYIKIEEFLSSYEVEQIIGAFMDEIVKIMKEYQIREKIQHMFEAFRSIDIQPLLNKALVPVKERLNELYSFDFKPLIDDLREYLMVVIEKIQSYDYKTLTMELRENVAEMTKIPCFGKLYGEFKLTSPHYNLKTTADLENTTTTSVTPEFKVNLNSLSKSTLKVLDFTVDASAHFAVPKMRRLTISENVNVLQSSFTLDHKGTMDFYGFSAQASAETTAKVTTELYDGELVNNAFLAVENGVSATTETTYKQALNMPVLSTFSNGMMNQKTVFGLEDGMIRLTVKNLVNGKYEIQDLSDEATHTSGISVEMDLHTAKVTFTGETNGNHLKMNQNVIADICIFRHVIIDAKLETETPFIKGSVAEVKFQAKVEDMKIDLTASHKADLVGQVEGKLSSSVLALMKPTELMFDSKNKGNAKVFLPFKLSGKVDLQNDITFTLNSEVHQASWTGLARFNQYKYSHFFSMDNGEREIIVNSQITGEANLDVLKKPITIPEMTLPFVDMKTPRVEDYSLWEDTGLGYLLTTTQQTFDMNSKLKYMKNPEMITININLDPVIHSINTNTKALHKKALIGKDKFAAILAASYDKAKAEYDKYSIELPKTIVVPGYKVPVMNVELSSFTIPLPDATLITMPALHVPSALSKLTIPKITLPKIQNIQIPVMGDLTYEFSVKTSMITLKADTSILNQDGISVKLEASSLSEFEILNGKIEGSTKVNTVGEFQMTSLMSVKHSMLEGNHQSTIVLSFKSVDASITNSAKVNLPSMSMEIKQEMKGNPAEGLVVSMSAPSAGLIATLRSLPGKRTLKCIFAPHKFCFDVMFLFQQSEQTDTDILGFKMSVVESKMLNVQTTWNMEMPYEMMLGMKRQVPAVMEMVSDPAARTYNKLNKHVRGLKGSFEKARRQGKAMFKKAVESLAAYHPSEAMTAVTDKTIVILREYQKQVKRVLDAVVTFLKQTKFQIPGYEQKLSGLEIYQKLSAFVADFSEEAVEKIPKYFTSVFAPALDHFKEIEFVFPGSNHIVSGKEILDELSVTLSKIQEQVIVTLRKLGAIQLEDFIKNYSVFVQFTTEQGEKLLQYLKTPNVENISRFLSEMYSDAMNSPALADVVRQVNEFCRIIMKYLTSVTNQLYSIVDSTTSEQLRTDILTWTESSVERVTSFNTSVIQGLKEKTKCVDQYIRLTESVVELCSC